MFGFIYLEVSKDCVVRQIKFVRTNLHACLNNFVAIVLIVLSILVETQFVLSVEFRLTLVTMKWLLICMNH